MTANSIVFIISILMTIFITLNSLRKVTGIKSSFFDKYDDILDKSAVVMTVIVFVLGIIDVLSAEFLGLNGYYILLAIYMSASLFLVSSVENARKRKKNAGIMSFILKSFTAVMLLEIFVFNFGSYHMIFGNYPQKIISADEATVKREKTSTNDTTYTFENIDVPVGTVMVDADIEGTNSLFMFKIGAADETSEPVREDAGSIWAVPGHQQTYIAAMNLSGDVSKLTVKTFLPNEQSATVNSIIINRPISVQFSVLRFIVLMGSLLFIYAALKAVKPVSENMSFLRNFVNAAVIIAMCAMTFMLITSSYVESGFSELFTLESGDQLTQDIVDAFESGHTYMTFEPDERILSMENPYDSNKRGELGLQMNIDYAWDHLLYNGKYYSYYGIAPVLLLFMPYHLITGYYFPTVIAVYLFAMVGIFFLSRIYIAFIERWFKDIPQGMAAVGIIIMLASCGIWFSVARPEFYEAAISAGFACICSGMYFLITSNILSEGKISLKRLVLSTVLLSLGVLSRPTTAVYCMCAVIFIIMGFKKAKEQFGGRNLKYLCSAFIPFIAIGSVQVIYNYVRFGSPLDFGIQYSLTINDFTKSQYHTQFVAVTIFNFIFNVPAFVPSFPFVSSDFQLLGTNGFYYKDASTVNAVSMGLIYRALPVFSYLFAEKAYKLSDSKNKKKAAAVISVFSIIAPFCILFSIWESGYAVRYTADFSWEVLIGAYAILFTLIIKCKNQAVKDILCKAFVFSMFFSFVVDFAQVYSFMLAKGTSENYKDIYYLLAKTFEFWN